ncbi:hypothetical protein DVH24_037655 [Malus domestica]|uniref:Uncharacterized protein n=1 Tax=Malus domestica TaxID=3750 RepID=A0A498IXS2_MALDO|nr:hypothetical protein DVH24_037655 [Malus domestica]
MHIIIYFSLGKLLERYQMHGEEEIGASKNAGGTDKVSIKDTCQAPSGLPPEDWINNFNILGREAQDLENLDVPELTQLEEELDALLRQTRSRKYSKSNRLVVKTHLSSTDNADTADDGKPYSSYRDAANSERVIGPKRKEKFQATVVASAGGDCDDTAAQPRAKKKIPRKTDDKLVAADSISTPAFMSLHDVMDDPYNFINRINVQHHSSVFHFFDLRKTSRTSH